MLISSLLVVLSVGYGIRNVRKELPWFIRLLLLFLVLLALFVRYCLNPLNSRRDKIKISLCHPRILNPLDFAVHKFE